MTTPTLPPEAEHNWREAGCSKTSCQHGHSHEWGRCAYGVEPEPTLMRLEKCVGEDGDAYHAFVDMSVAEVAAWLREQGYTVTAPGGDPLPDWLAYPGDDLARALPDGGWCGHGGGWSKMPRLRPGLSSLGCEARLPRRPPASRRPGEPRSWLCTDHVSGWHVAVGVAVMAIWRLPNGGDQS